MVHLYVVILDQFFIMVIFRFAASHTVKGSFTKISTLSGMLCAKINQKHSSHIEANIPNANFFIF
jgi:hypothetical protein